MNGGSTPEKAVPPDLARAAVILNRLGLSWENIEGKRVLDIGSAEAVLAQAAAYRNSTAAISSIDIKRSEKWSAFLWGNRERPIQGEAERLPFKNDSFDYAIMHGSTGSSAIPEAVRVLRSGGEMRMMPIAGIELEYWNIAYYLDTVQGVSQQEIADVLEKYDRQIEEADGWIPNGYAALRKEALDALSHEQKLEVIDLLARRYSEMLGLQFTYEVNNPDAYEPNAVLIYKKEL